MFLDSNARESKVALPGQGSPTITKSLLDFMCEYVCQLTTKQQNKQTHK